MDRGGGRFGFGLSHTQTGDDGAKVSWSWIHAKGVGPRLWHTPSDREGDDSCAAGSVLGQAQQSNRSTERSVQLFVTLRRDREDRSFWGEK